MFGRGYFFSIIKLIKKQIISPMRNIILAATVTSRATGAPISVLSNIIRNTSRTPIPDGMKNTINPTSQLIAYIPIRDGMVDKLIKAKALMIRYR